MAIELAGLLWDIAQAYLDDILVAGASFEEHLMNLDDVFTRLAKHGLKLNAGKCELFWAGVNDLWHIMGRSGIRPLASNMEAIVQFPVLCTVHQLQSFNGMVNFYKKFVPDSMQLIKPHYMR